MSESAVLEAERSMLTGIVDVSRAGNAADARKLAMVKEFFESRTTYRAASLDARFDTDMAGRSAIAEIALTLATTYHVVAEWLRISFTLHRFPYVTDAFDDGVIPLSKIRTILTHTAGAPPDVLRLIEPAIVTAAQRLATRPLGDEIDRLLLETDPDATERSNERGRKARAVSTRRRAHGMADVNATVTAAEAAEVNDLINHMVRTVCPRDPRDLRQLRVDAYLAILRGRTTLRCECGCEKTATTEADARPDVRLNVMCSLDTLLGLGKNPGYLAGYGAIDPATLRDLAEDATWQALIHAAEAFDDDESNDDEFERLLAEDPEELVRCRDLWAPPSPNAGLDNSAATIVTRSPKLNAGTVFPPSTSHLSSTRSKELNAILDRYRGNPDLAQPDFPDGHGGFTKPPPGALTYRPSELLAAVVRLRDGTCRHPGCTVPAEDCQIDHLVAYLHAHPESGGWTILANLQCLCLNHHQLKTAKFWFYEMLRDNIIHAISKLGQHGFTLPAHR
ncbi:HNH endonuclease signature motif containing protein [Antrihabitans cavernicola]|nr:HNH endonuclease signature motif containing protein [Spelaeibacter cavernicola]